MLEDWAVIPIGYESCFYCHRILPAHSFSRFQRWITSARQKSTNYDYHSWKADKHFCMSCGAQHGNVSALFFPLESCLDKQLLFSRILVCRQEHHKTRFQSGCRVKLTSTTTTVPARHIHICWIWRSRLSRRSQNLVLLLWLSEECRLQHLPRLHWLHHPHSTCESRYGSRRVL